MGDEVAEEKTGMLRMLYTMEPEKRKSTSAGSSTTGTSRITKSSEILNSPGGSSWPARHSAK